MINAWSTFLSVAMLKVHPTDGTAQFMDEFHRFLGMGMRKVCHASIRHNVEHDEQIALAPFQVF